MKMIKNFIIITAIIFSHASQAKRFGNGYTEFELPPGWQCAMEGSEWVCQSENKDRKKEAIIILAAKKRGPQDSLAEYQAYLKKTKSYELPGGKRQVSEPKSVRVKTINSQQWVDSLHLASEVPGFYTRYLATVKADIGVAVTFSVTKNLYNAYKGIFDNVIASLRVFRQQNKNLSKLKLGNGSLGNNNFEDATFVPQDDTFDIARASRKKRSSDSDGDSSMLWLLLIGVGAFFILKKLKK